MEHMAHHMITILCDDDTSEIGLYYCGDGPKGQGAVRNEIRRRRPTWRIKSLRFSAGAGWEGIACLAEEDPE